MLSTRGEIYAKAGLADGYLGPPKTVFDKDTKQGVVSFSNAENFLMQDIMLEYIRTQVSSSLDRTTLTYHEGPFGSSRLRTAMTNLITSYFHPATPISPNNIVFANGVTSLNAISALNLTNPGDGILLGQPIYGSFTGDLRVPSECQLIYTPFHGDDPFSPDAVTRYEETFLKARDETGVTIRALLICNPHNPLGRCYSRETLEALLLFCQKYQIHLISDEVYALSVYSNDDSVGFISVLSIDPVPLGVDPALIHVLYGMSKDFAAAGLRLGCLISRNQGLLQAALSMSIAGFFLWIDLSKCLDNTIVGSQGEWAAELDLSRRLQQIGVVMSSGYAYHNEVAGWFRVIFSVEVESLKVGLSRIIEFYNSSGTIA
ncbi:hypothetical protein PCG10_000283 [Penicillium crustosum]|uniref:Aminotransferase class I/classII large domain-containing protein n=1 Tax=Penicillium crustosum TaxID=36656 RepID=A0A9P5GWF2_PENCR|nr:hypothetical protein PCG10_000283 [Penicillium crustosum]